ncbi:Mitochondrial import inner membrane translocase subunit TIM16 [Smittium mucronatum]|uniref:Mitochondrial import inner membrane translocase subunit TIM16 n=1 Tax=Smittium mucronatum TaxID=133383 RepID=A0A1R0H543_9FUNG|nr:Mitochondrial import inner membrane translocase subunit TIM16 [Smittium mucronatum]
MTRKTGIALDESVKILNVDEIKDMDKIREKYEHLFKMNDPKDGGSLYLQAKVVRAFERVQIEYMQNIARHEAEAKASSESEGKTTGADDKATSADVKPADADKK